jgi:hypothetical protein
MTRRQLYTDVGWRKGYSYDVTVSRRAGDDVIIDFRYSWAPDDRDDAYDRLQQATVDGDGKEH